MKTAAKRVGSLLRDTRRRIVEASATPDHFVTDLVSHLVVLVFLFLTVLAAVAIVLSPVVLLLWYADVFGAPMLIAMLALPALLIFVLAVGYYYQS